MEIGRWKLVAGVRQAPPSPSRVSSASLSFPESLSCSKLSDGPHADQIQLRGGARRAQPSGEATPPPHRGIHGGADGSARPRSAAHTGGMWAACAVKQRARSHRGTPLGPRPGLTDSSQVTQTPSVKVEAGPLGEVSRLPTPELRAGAGLGRGGRGKGRRSASRVEASDDRGPSYRRITASK